MKKLYISVLFETIFLINCIASEHNVIADTTGLASSFANNVTELLRGRIAGVRVSGIDGNPNGTLNVNIRGLNSVRTDNQPLWIIDGAPLNTGLNQNLDAFWQYGEESYTAALNPMAFLFSNEIESIEVIKNISATSLYGSRGANGVIIVNTKLPTNTGRVLNWQSNIALNTWEGISSLQHSHHFSIGGAENRSRYNISADFRNINGVLPGNTSNYGGAKVNFDTYAGKIVHFGLNALLSIGESDSPSGTAWLGKPSMTLALMNPVLSPNTTYDQWKEDYSDHTRDLRTLTSTFITLNFSPSFSWSNSLGLDLQYNNRGIWYGKSTDFGRDNVPGNQNGGAGGVMTSLLFNYSLKSELKYRIIFQEEHNLNLLLGAEYIGDVKVLNTMNGRDFVSHSLRQYGIGLACSPIEHHKFDRNYSHFGTFFSAEYDWKDSVGATASLRYDYAPKYKGAIQNLYPALEAYLDLSQILKIESNLISKIRFEIGWGKSGKEQYIPYELFGNYLSSDWYQPAPTTEAFYDGMDRLLTSEFNAGFRVDFLKNRVSMKATFYNRKSDDVFSMFCLGECHNATLLKTRDYWDWKDPSVVFERASAVGNRGFELEADALVIKKADLCWNLSANFSYNVNRMISSNPEDFYGRVVGHDVYCSANALDLPVSSLIGYEIDPVTGIYKDQTGEGVISIADKVMLGNTIPKFFGGIQSALVWRRWNFELDIDGAAGHKIANINSLIADAPTPDSEGKIALTSKYVEDGDFFRIGRMSINYKMPVKLKWIHDLNVHLDVRNLAVISKYSGWNPDVNSFGINSLSCGFDYGSYPLNKTFVLGVNLNF